MKADVDKNDEPNDGIPHTSQGSFPKLIFAIASAILAQIRIIFLHFISHSIIDQRGFEALVRSG